MKQKLKTFVMGGIFGIAGLCLIAPLAKEGVVSAAKAEVHSVTVAASDITLDTTSPQNVNYFYFNLAENDLLIASGGDRYKATAASNTLIHKDKNGVETAHAVNIAKETKTKYYVQFDNWSGDKFSVAVGDSIILNGTATHKDGDNITFSNVTVQFTEYGYTIGDVVSANIARNECFVREDATATNIYIKAYGKMTTYVGKAANTYQNVITYIPAGGEATLVKSTSYVNDGNTFTMGLYNGTTKITISTGDQFKVENVKFAVIVGNTINLFNVEYMHAKWNGTKWENIADVSTKTYTASNVTKFESYVSGGSPVVIYTFDSDNDLPADNHWDKGLTVDGAMKVTRADGTVFDNKQIWTIKPGAKQMEIIYNLSWKASSKFDFQLYDIVELNFTVVVSNVYNTIKVTYSNLVLVFNGTAFARADGLVGKYIYDDKNTYLNATQRAKDVTGIYIPWAEDDTTGHDIPAWSVSYGTAETSSFKTTRSGQDETTKFALQTSSSGYYLNFEYWATGRTADFKLTNGDQVEVLGMFVINYTVNEVAKSKLIIINNLKYSVSNDLINRVVPTIETFVTDYMHMDYTENLGYCKDSEHHYYSSAKTAFNAMDEAYRKVLVNEPTYKPVFDRLVAWAEANGETIDANTLTISQFEMPSVLSIGGEENSLIIITVIGLVSVTAVALILLKKKKTTK